MWAAGARFVLAMPNARARRVTFLTVCLPTRVALAVGAALVASHAPHAAPYMAIPAFMAAVGFLVFFCRRPAVGGCGGPVWWRHLRPVHATLYATFGILALTLATDGTHRGVQDAVWIPLAVDAFLSLAWFAFHEDDATASLTRHLPNARQDA